MIRNFAVQPQAMSREERIRSFPACTCGLIPMSQRCKAKSAETHVCTQRHGHKGAHHSHIAPSRVFSEWIDGGETIQHDVEVMEGALA